jgi:hypothetical protein
LIDVKSTGKKGFKKVKQGEVVDEERFKISQHSSIQTSMKRADFKQDVLPYLYLMIHPNVRDMNTSLFSQHEKQAFNSAIELMVMFDIKLGDETV